MLPENRNEPGLEEAYSTCRLWRHQHLRLLLTGYGEGDGWSTTTDQLRVPYSGIAPQCGNGMSTALSLFLGWSLLQDEQNHPCSSQGN